MAGPALSLSLPLLFLLLPAISSPQLIPPTSLDHPHLPSSPQTPSTHPSAIIPSGNHHPHHARPPGLVSFTGGKGRYKKMAREFLLAHNQVREVEGQRPYVWDKSLAHYARRWAEQRREKCDTIHSHGPYGENLFWGTGWDWKAEQAVQHWAEEHLYYDRTARTCSPGKMCGHFTQIVWNSTAKVGCARVECHHGGVIISCNYDPPGNYVGEDPFTS